MMGVDVLIDPRSITVSKILLKLRQGRFANLFSLENGLGEVVEGVVKESAPIVGLDPLSGDLPEGLSVGGVLRDSLPVPLTEKIAVNDRVILFAEKEMSRKVDVLFRVNPEQF
jgi:trk system potassium uptake protein TrkA